MNTTSISNSFSLNSRIMLVLLILGFSDIHAQTIRKMDDATWNAINDIVLDEYNSDDLKGISVAVVYGGNIAYANAFGNRNEAGDPFTIYTKSLLASISKTITGVLAMRLVQNGDIALNDLVGDYLPLYSGTGIAIRDLLCHQSGIGHYDNCPGGYNGAFNGFNSMLVVAGCEICITPPGSGTLYTTFGSTLLGSLIDVVADDEYNSTYTGLYNAWMKEPGGLATLDATYHNIDPALAEGEEGPGYWTDIGWKLPAGGFISDILDLANYARGMLNNVFITRATYDMMMVEQIPNGTPNVSCSSVSPNNYGLAFAVAGNPNDDDFVTWHNGENDHGFSSYLAIYPNWNAAVVMMTNTENASGTLGSIHTQIADLITCPDRNFTNDISWTEPRVFEGGQITGQSEITSTLNEAYIFDADQWVKLTPGFHAPAGKIFRAIVYDGCGGSVETD